MLLCRKTWPASVAADFGLPPVGAVVLWLGAVISEHLCVEEPTCSLEMALSCFVRMAHPNPSTSNRSSSFLSLFIICLSIFNMAMLDSLGRELGKPNQFFSCLDWSQLGLYFSFVGLRLFFSYNLVSIINDLPTVGSRVSSFQSEPNPGVTLPLSRCREVEWGPRFINPTIQPPYQCDLHGIQRSPTIKSHIFICFDG